MQIQYFIMTQHKPQLDNGMTRRRQLSGLNFAAILLLLVSVLGGCGRSQSVSDATGATPASPNPPTGGFLQGPGTFVVDSTDDATDALPGDGRCATAAGKCSLRAAVQETNSTLLLSTDPLVRTNLIIIPEGRYVLTLAPPRRSVVGESASLSGQLSFLGSTNVRGAGTGKTIIDGNGTDRIFALVAAAVVSISDLTITNGAASGIWNEGQLTLTRVVLTKNKGLYGGGVFNTPTSAMIMDSCVVADNEAESEGGGIRCDAACLIINSTISGNKVTFVGDSYDGSSMGEGGGIDHRTGAPLTIVNSTIVGNHAATGGGGINTAVSYQGGHGVLDDTEIIGRPVELINTIVAGNTTDSGPRNCKSTISQIRSFGGNIADDDSCGLTFSRDLPNTNPQLGEMVMHDGAPLGFGLQPGSPAVGNGLKGNCPYADPTGLPRGDRCDSGAVQSQ